MWIFNTVEFYVIATLVAAMLIAFAAKPASKGEARQYLLAGDLSAEDENASPAISLHALDNGKVVLRRTGLSSMTSSSAVSLAITVIGWDISIEERLSEGYSLDSSIDTATFYLDFIAPERYHIRYNSSSTGLFAATQFNNRPGYKVTRALSQ